jgi:uncharacterized protein YndB with AHSA1/START domain
MWTVSRRIQTPADAVWQLLVDLDDWPRWGPTVQRAELDGGVLALGTKGRVWTPIGLPLPFEITEFVPGRSWAWQVAGVPATRHGVDPEDDGCRAWMSAPLWAPAYLPVLAIALQRIEAMAGSSAAA